MNNIMTAKTGFIRSKEAMSFIKNGGKYGCIALGIYGLYDLCVRAMEKDYAFNVDVDLEGKVHFNFKPSTVTVE